MDELKSFCPHCRKNVKAKYKGRGKYPDVFYECPLCSKTFMKRELKEVDDEHYDYNIGA